MKGRYQIPQQLPSENLSLNFVGTSQIVCLLVHGSKDAVTV